MYYIIYIYILLLCIFILNINNIYGYRQRDRVKNKLIDLSLYHTTDQLEESFKTLALRCPQLKISYVNASNSISLLKVQIKRVKNPKHRIMMIFGEHARELISPESALELAEHFCGTRKDVVSQIGRILATSEILMFPNVNPKSRRIVEEGNYCLRSNENGVDLNRNWDDHWQDDRNHPSEISRQSFGGSHAFSEPETIVLKTHAEKFRPTIFFTIHSGTLGMYMPYAYDGKVPHNNPSDQKMMNILRELNQKYCRCHWGPAGKEVGYLCPGTCLDYVYDKLGCRYAYGVEIWGSHGYMVGKPHNMLLEIDENIHQNINQRVDKSFPPPNSTHFKHCLHQFNPTTRDMYEVTVSHWSRAFLDMIDESMAAAESDF